MFRPRKRKRTNEIPTASLSDMAFIMLFFFLSTTTFDMKNGLGLVLPGPTTDDTVRARITDENLTRINISEDGVIAIDNEIYTLYALENKARHLVNINPEMVFMLRTHRQSQYVNMVEVLDRLRLAGAERINLSTN
jgi:biopolymer transport protein ExbD